MRTVKHLIRPVKFNHKNQPLKMVENLTEKELIQEFLSVIYQYQKGKNYFLEKLNENKKLSGITKLISIIMPTFMIFVKFLDKVKKLKS